MASSKITYQYEKTALAAEFPNFAAISAVWSPVGAEELRRRHCAAAAGLWKVKPRVEFLRNDQGVSDEGTTTKGKAERDKAWQRTLIQRRDLVS